LDFRLSTFDSPGHRLGSAPATASVFVAAWWCAALAFLAAATFADEKDDDEPQLIPGLVARYEASGVRCVRRDEAVQFVWGDRSPDERLPPGSFSAEWSGQLTVMSPGKHRFYLYAAGEASLNIDGKEIISGGGGPRWFESPAVDLEFGQHPLALAFKKTSGQARLGLYWSGPRFELEPVPGRLLAHQPADDPDDAFERGAELWRALRCANCHKRAGERAGLPAPSLANLSGNISRVWLVDWLRCGDLATHEGEAESEADERSPIRMPRFDLTETDAHAVAAFLVSDAPAKTSTGQPMGDLDRGRRLFMTLGCLACHQVGDLGASGMFGGGDLSFVADKRPADFFSRWLADPAQINSAHRMPVFRLSESERDDLATWLITLRHSTTAEKAVNNASASHGRRIVEVFRCGACHQLPDQIAAAGAIALHAKQVKDWRQTCLGAADRPKSRPGYVLSQRDREATITYLTTAATTSTPPVDGRFVLRERNCLACHARDAAPGIAERAVRLVEGESELAPLLPTLTPPALTGVGDKLHDAALADAITLRHPPLRPWLAVRMPRFNLADEELRSLTDYFTTIDRIPERPRPEPKVADKTLTAAGGRLVTAAGFGCTSCHKIGNASPIKVAIAAHGTNLSLLGKRIRRAWFDRWVRNPARIVPRMEMPAIQVPARGVLGDKLDAQLAAVWHVLNAPGFEPPPAGPIRVARHLGDDTPPIVITDVIEIEKRLLVRPVTIGLANRHNMLFDFSGNQLVGWWLGDTALQQTRGKSWYWEPAGANFFTGELGRGSEAVLLSDDGRPLTSVPQAGDSLTELDWFDTSDGAVELAYRLRFADGAERISLRVKQRFSMLNDANGQGVRRRWEIAGLPADHRLQLRILPAGHAAPRVSHGVLIASYGRFYLEARTAAAVDRMPTDGCLILEPPKKGDTVFREVDYVTSEVPPAAAASPPSQSLLAADLSVVPGFEAVQLPLPPSEMPTGLSWGDDGKLAFCSLKGGVWLATDTDGDSLEDRLQLVADGLAAPYGIACEGKAIDVAAKYGLVRLSQLDEESRARRTDVIASGWGYTADYHDWTIGLPRDAAGNYFIGLPCQQDNRSTAEAHLRGTVLKLSPREPTPDSPRLFNLDVVSAGLRFPMGLAIDDDGELFASDNQGNYNPFNELNHLRQGARYGFINKLDAKPGYQPPYDDPAVAIPHPWTRSVNGICFLTTPAEVRKALGHGVFGPFEGHLIGCEFDTRRLIRMSLEKVGETYQGAAYPFSIEAAAGEPTFEGPVVAAVSPRGDLYIGNLRDSGWGGGQNTGSFVRLRPAGSPPVGIAEVHVLPDGFAIDFTAPVDCGLATQPETYAISSYRRVTTPAYGGPDVDRESESPATVELSADARRATLRLKRMRAGFVYEFQLKNLAGGNQEFFPAEAHYTLREMPLKQGK
jgi:mono/diheme cytochrome c family protein